MVTRQLTTVADLLELPDSSGRFELIDGEVLRMSPASPDHAWISTEIARLIANYASERGLGEVFGSDIGYVIARDPDTLLSPDVSFVRSERLPPPDQWRSFFQFSPDIAFEVLSPSNTPAEMTEKIRRYFSAGSTFVVVVSPRTRSVAVHAAHRPVVRLNSGDSLDLGDVIPAFQIPVRALFRRLIPSS